MAKYEFDKKKFEEWKAAQKESAAIQEKMNSSLSGYFETMSKIKELQKNIQFIEQKVTQLKEEQAKAESNLLDNTNKLNKARASGDAAEIKALEKKEEELKKIIAAKKEGVKITEAELKLLKEQTAQLTESAKQASLIGAGLSSAVGFLGKTPGLIKQGFGMLKGTGIFEMDKEIRNAVRSMAGGQKQYNNMYNSITGAARSTTMWGVGVKDLAIMQKGYSEEIGRSVMLTERGYKSMAKLAEGTGLGKEFAVQIAGSMDKFNISAERTSQIVENTMNTAAKIGVNGAAALKALQNNLKLAQRFNFKGGIAGLAKLSAEATRLRLDMEGISGMAEKVFRPEGAIEMAAQLTTMGGKFAALGDPMQLMFQARNDPETFAKNIGKASAEFGQFNEKTGEFELKGGLALDRMREISNITGIAVEKLQEMAEAQARVESVKSKLKGGMFNEEDTELISSMAKFDKKKGWVINLNGQDKLVKDLRATDMKNIRAEQEKLDKRAEDARTFDETIQDLILTFKQELLPFAKELKAGLGGPIQDMVKTWKEEGAFKTLKEFVTKSAEIISGVGKLLIDGAEWLGPGGTLAVLFGGKLLGPLLDIGKWFLNGMSLGRGFMSVAGGMGGSMPGGNFSSKSKGFGGGRGNFSSSQLMKSGVKNIGKGNVLKGSTRLLKGVGKGLGPLALLGTGVDLFSNMTDENLDTGDALLKTLDQNKYMAMGAAIGSIIPGLGTIAGAGIGGLVDMFAGEWGTYGKDGKNKGKHKSTGVPTVRKVNDAIMFHEQDKFLKVNDGMMLASTQKGQLHKAATELTGGGSYSTPSEMTHKFEDMKITIDVNIPGNEKLGVQLANTPEFIRRINEAINKEIAMASGGGKLSGGGPKKTKKK